MAAQHFQDRLEEAIDCFYGLSACLPLLHFTISGVMKVYRKREKEVYHFVGKWWLSYSIFAFQT